MQCWRNCYFSVIAFAFISWHWVVERYCLPVISDRFRSLSLCALFPQPPCGLRCPLNSRQLTQHVNLVDGWGGWWKQCWAGGGLVVRVQLSVFLQICSLILTQPWEVAAVVLAVRPGRRWRRGGSSLHLAGELPSHSLNPGWVQEFNPYIAIFWSPYFHSSSLSPSGNQCDF